MLWLEKFYNKVRGVVELFICIFFFLIVMVVNIFVRLVNGINNMNGRVEV